jgi:glucosyl-3-phosphoglycerate synthase
MATEVSRVIHHYSREAGRFHVEQINEMYEVQRQAIASFEYVLTRQKNRTKLLLLDMDALMAEGQFVEALAVATGVQDQLTALAQDQSLSDLERCEQLTELFKFVHRSQFEKVAMAMSLKPGIIEFVNHMRREHFMVGVISSHYFVATEIIRKRIFADFALAHIAQFQNDICTGKVIINDAFRSELNRLDQVMCKSHVLDQFRAKTSPPRFKEIWVIANGEQDIKLLTLADKAFAINPNTEEFARYPHIQCVSSFASVAESLT